MGRVKTVLIKRLSLKLLEKHRDRFTEDFNGNKAIVEEFTDVNSAKLRNSIAGYIARLVKKGEEKKPYTPKRDYEIQG